MSNPRFALRKTSNQQIRFNLIAANNKVVLTSETYTELSHAKDGISAVRTAAQVDANFKRLLSTSQEPYFNLEAANHKVVGTSEMYSSASERDQGIEVVMRLAPSAEVVDERG